MSDLVRCTAGWQYPERPTEVLWESDWLRVESVIKQWHEPSGYYYWVICDNEYHFELFYNAHNQNWYIRLLMGS